MSAWPPWMPSPNITTRPQRLNPAAVDWRNFLDTSSYRDFSTPLHGKTVAIVGPAAYVESAPSIEAIVERADVVVRPNVRVDETGELVLPRGTTRRVDVVYHSGTVLNELVGHGRKKDVATAFSALTLHTLERYDANGVGTVIVVVCGATFRTRALANLTTQFFARAPNSRMRLLLGSNAGGHDCPAPLDHFRTGVRAIVDVHRQRPARIFLFGFDFYQSQRHGFPGYYRDTNNENPALAVFHNTSAEMEAVAWLLLLGLDATNERTIAVQVPSLAPVDMFIDAHEADVLRQSMDALCSPRPCTEVTRQRVRNHVIGSWREERIS